MRKKVNCNSCKFFIKTITHIINYQDKPPDVSLCSKIGFRIVEKGDPPIYCNYYEKKEPPYFTPLYISKTKLSSY